MTNQERVGMDRNGSNCSGIEKGQIVMGPDFWVITVTSLLRCINCLELLWNSPRECFQSFREGQCAAVRLSRNIDPACEASELDKSIKARYKVMGQAGEAMVSALKGKSEAVIPW